MIDSVLEATPAKQRKSVLDYNFCIICQQPQASKDVTRSISIELTISLLKILYTILGFTIENVTKVFRMSMN